MFLNKHCYAIDSLVIFYMLMMIKLVLIIYLMCLDDMTMRRLTSNTQKNYIRAVKTLSEYLGKVTIASRGILILI